MRRPPGAGAAFWVAAAVALSMATYAPALWFWDRSGWGDWQQFHHWWEVGRVSILRWGEIPLWDPHHCGGVSMWGQPQSQLYAPTWWITGLPFGTVHGHKLFILLHHAVGWLGMLVLARRIHGLSNPPSVLAATVWALGGFFAWRGAGGHSSFLAFHYIPWILVTWRWANRDVRWSVAVAGLMALQLLEGGTYPFPLTFLVLFFDAASQLLRRRPDWRVLRTAAVGGVLTGLLGSIRLLPVYLTMSRFPRETRMEDAQSIDDLLRSLTAREPQPWQWGHRWVWAEYGSFIGWTCLLLAGLGAVLALRDRKRLPLVFGVVVFAACAMGNVGPWWPWPLLHELPVFGSFHVPSRFHVLLVLYLTLLAGVAVEWLARALRRAAGGPRAQRLAVILAWVLVAGVGVDVLSNSVRIAARWDGPAIDDDYGGRFHLVRPIAYLENYAHYPRRNVGSSGCYDPVPWPIARGLWFGDVPQARLEPRTAGEVLDWGRSNVELWAEVELSEPARVFFNQNYDDGWWPSVGTAVDDAGLYAVDVPAGRHRIVSSYMPRDMPWTMSLVALGLLLSGLLLFYARPRGSPLLPAGRAVTKGGPGAPES